MPIGLTVFAIALVAAFACLCAVVDRFFLSEKPVKPLAIACCAAFALCLIALGFSVEEKPGTVVGSRTYHTAYYIGGMRVGSSGPYTRSQIVGRVTILGEVALFCLLAFSMGFLNAACLVYAKEKAKEKGGGVFKKICIFYIYSLVSYFTLGILAFVHLAGERSKRFALAR